MKLTAEIGVALFLAILPVEFASGPDQAPGIRQPYYRKRDDNHGWGLLESGNWNLLPTPRWDEAGGRGGNEGTGARRKRGRTRG